MKICSFFFVLVLSIDFAKADTQASPLDLRIRYYSKVVTAEGVTREVRYEDIMLRRPGVVWLARVLPRPKNINSHSDNHAETVHIAHKHFNPVILPRLIRLTNSKPQLEYVDVHNRQIISVPPGEYGNVSFDGSWSNAYYLIDPKLINAMPMSSRVSSVSGARWREATRGNTLHRVLWDGRRQIALVIESEDRAAATVHRVEVDVDEGLASALPWRDLEGYAQREYGDFLD